MITFDLTINVSAKLSAFNTSARSTESTLHWQEFVRVDLLCEQIRSSSNDAGAGWFFIHKEESWSSFLSQPWPVGDGISRLVSRALPYILDNSHVYVGSNHPLLVTNDVVLAYFPYRTFYSVYLFHLAFHIDDKTIFEIFETHLYSFLFYLPVGIHFAKTVPSF